MPYSVNLKFRLARRQPILAQAHETTRHGAKLSPTCKRPNRTVSLRS